MKLLFTLFIFCPATWAAQDKCDRYLAGSDEWKLIRDRLPQIFAAEGDSAIVDQVTDPAELKRLLLLKLKEEIQEFEESPSAEELADILETLNAIQTQFGFAPGEVADVQTKKRAKKGGFEKGFVLKK